MIQMLLFIKSSYVKGPGYSIPVYSCKCEEKQEQLKCFISSICYTSNFSNIVSLQKALEKV